jgi:quercetin dioxygenase-like cupin family protein
MISEARARMEADGLEPSSWSNGPGDRYAAHQHRYDKVIVAATGSIVFGLPDRGESIELRAGDRLDLPSGTVHEATVGSAGVVCLEAHLAPGALGSGPRVTRDWVESETAAARPA